MAYKKLKIDYKNFEKFFMAIRTSILPLFHQKGLKSSFLGQIDNSKNLYYSKFNFRHEKENCFLK